MSGGHYDYKYMELVYLADEIKGDFSKDGKYKSEITEKEHDYLSDASEIEKNIILQEVKSLIRSLRFTAKRVKELEWYLSGDHGANSYLTNLSKLTR